MHSFMFQEQLEWAVGARVDFIIAETFMYFGEAKLALKSIKKYAPGNDFFMVQLLNEY